MEHSRKNPLTVLIIAHYEPTFDWVQEVLQDQNYKTIGRVESVEQALKKAQRTHIDIIVADTSAEGVLNVNWIKRAAIDSPGTLILVIAASTEMNFVRDSMLAGAQGFLLKPFDLADLTRSITEVHQLWLQRNALLAEAKTKTETNRAYAIALFSPKGGSGVTTLAVNLAIALRQTSNEPVLLVDGDLDTADVDVFLNVYSEHSILDVLRLDQAIDHELLEQVVSEHAGIKVLRGDSNLQFIDSPAEPGEMGALIEELMSTWDGYIVINTTNGLRRETVEVIDVVDTVLLVTTPELPALRAMRNFLELAEAQTDTSGKWQVVMNAYQNQRVLRMADIETSIHYPVKVTISQDMELVSASINRGTPLMVSHSKSPVAKDILALARQLTEAHPRRKKSAPADGKHAHASGETSGKRFSIRGLFSNFMRPSDPVEQTAG